MSIPWQDAPIRYREVEVERNVPSRMRDGTVLYADIHRPKGDGPWPVLLMRHPYDKTQAENLSYSNFPTFDRNSNSGQPLTEASPADWFVATQTVFHDSRYPSHIVLPVIK